MTSTSVKDVSSMLTNLTPVMGNRATGIDQSGFQAVLNNQSQKNAGNQAAESRPQANRSATGSKPGDSLKAKDADRVQPGEKKAFSAGNEGEEPEMTPEEMEEAMAVLETAAVELIQKTADLLQIPVEEVQDLMEDMGLEKLDILDPKQLGALFLQAGGVEDSYALITNGELYEDYQALMDQLEAAVQQCGERLGVDSVQMPVLLEKIQEKPVVQGEAPIVELSEEKPETESVVPNVSQAAVQDDAAVDTPKDTTSGDRGHGRKETDSDDRGQQNGNAFLQNLRTEEFRPEVQQTTETARMAEAENTEHIMRQIMDYMKVQLKADTTNLEMQLHPASLGTVQVQIASRGGAVTANFITQNEAVKAALESQMAQLIERFDEQGVKVEAVEVTVQAHAFERNLEQGQGRGQQNGEPARKGRTRRIDLNNPISMEDMEEEDALAADMMAANGNTVDYTA
ncbi:MAG: flagellar hook-length control protein FliK [Lachnospiraceae bacterium]|nr:flagellar hook-length control protein FliK [Lachnospiraceae bacterium]MCM1238862.1 flagellar hook-length control protein FliK [Lachnospiraceae bacterium]